jgi:hypothetical protein
MPSVVIKYLLRMAYTKQIKKELAIKTQICGLYTLFSKYKGISGKYKGKDAQECFLLSFFAGSFNQFNSFARLLYL